MKVSLEVMYNIFYISKTFLEQYEKDPTSADTKMMSEKLRQIFDMVKE